MILFIYGSLGSFQECWPWKELKDRYPHGVSILQMWMTSKVFWTRSHTGCGPPRSQTPVFSPYSWPLCQSTSGPPRLYFTEVPDPECSWPSSPEKSSNSLFPTSLWVSLCGVAGLWADTRSFSLDALRPWTPFPNSLAFWLIQKILAEPEEAAPLLAYTFVTRG